jgi:hypothetical protein
MKHIISFVILVFAVVAIGGNKQHPILKISD